MKANRAWTASSRMALVPVMFTGDAAAVEEQVRQAYYDTPAAALGMPECSVALYPETGAGTQRIVEILLDYPEEPTVLQQKSQQLQEQAAAILAPIQHQIASRRLDLLMGTLSGTVRVDLASGGATAWDALVGQGANDEGLALAFQLLCDGLGLKGQMVEGTLQGEPHFFNQVDRNGQIVWVDLSRSTGQTYTAAQMLDMGYQWPDQEA